MADAAAEYAQHIPMRVIADMLGFPPEDGPRFREFVESVLEGINLPPEDRIERMEGLFNYLLEQVHDHLDHPRDDITSYLIGAEIFGQKLTAEHVTGAMALLLIAGIDTTWSAIGSSLWHLARNPADLRAAGGRARAAADRDGGVPPRLRPGHHGPAGQAGHALARRGHEGRRLDPAVVPGGQP